MAAGSLHAGHDDALASYCGHMAGSAATNRESLGTAPNRQVECKPAVPGPEDDAFETTLRGSTPTAQIVHRFRVALNGMSALTPEHLIEAIRQLPAVKAEGEMPSVACLTNHR